MDQFNGDLERDAEQLFKGIITKDELNLERLALVRMSKTLWSADWVKEELIKIGITDTRKYDVLWRKSEPTTFFALLKKVEECCYSLHLADSSVAMLQDIIEDMGTQIFWFLPYLLNKIEVRGSTYHEKKIQSIVTTYMNNLQWTDTGRIDYEVTLRKIVNKNLIRDRSMEISELCTNCFEEEIFDWFRQFDDKLVKLKRCIKKLQPLGSDMVAYWLWRYQNKHIDRNNTLNFKSFYQSSLPRFKNKFGLPHDIAIEDDLPLDVNMLLICAKNGFYLGVKYFWSRLNENLRILHFIETLRRSFGKPDFWHLSGTRMDITIFLLRTMSLEHCCQLLGAIQKGEISAFKSITLLTRTWKDFTFPTLDVFKKYIPLTSRFYSDTATQVFEALLYLLFMSNEQPSRKRKLKDLAFEILYKYPEVINYTREVDEGLIYKSMQKVTICRLLYSEEMPLIKAFINHEAMLHWRDSFLSHAADHYCRIQSSQKENSDHGTFVEFQQSVLLNDMEREHFLYIIGQMHESANAGNVLHY